MVVLCELRVASTSLLAICPLPGSLCAKVFSADMSAAEDGGGELVGASPIVFAELALYTSGFLIGGIQSGASGRGVRVRVARRGSVALRAGYGV